MVNITIDIVYIRYLWMYSGNNALYVYRLGVVNLQEKSDWNYLRCFSGSFTYNNVRNIFFSPSLIAISVPRAPEFRLGTVKMKK